jgi:hypothetical protein
MSGEQTGRRGHRQLVDGLLDAAWLRVQLGPLERYRSRGPFEPASVAGALGLAPGDLLALERAAIEHVLGDHAASLDPPNDARWPDAPRESALEQAGADASATLISLAVELADAIGEREYVTREGLDPLIREAVGRDLGRLLDERAPYSYQEAAESLGRITDSAINHGVKSFGPIVILAPAVDAIAAVVARTVANLCPWDWEQDEGQDEVGDVW